MVIGVSSNQTTRAGVLPTSLSFDSTNWSSPQTVTVRGNYNNGAATVSHRVTSTGDNTNYPTTLTIPSVAVTVTDAPDVEISSSTAAFSHVNEGATITYTLTIDTAQSEAVTVAVLLAEERGENQQFLAGSSTQFVREVTIPANQTQVTFTVIPTEDTTDETNGQIEAEIRERKNAAVNVLTGFGYERGSNYDWDNINILENDATSVTLARSGSGAIAENGGTETVTVTLGRRLYAVWGSGSILNGEEVIVPLTVTGSGITSSDYTLALSSDTSLNDGVDLITTTPHSAAQPALRFRGHATDTVQVATLTLTATNDSVDEGSSETLALGFGSTSNRWVISNLDTTLTGANLFTNTGGTTTSGAPTVEITDDDEAGTVFDPTALTVLEGGSGTYSVKLSQAPTTGNTTTVTVSTDPSSSDLTIDTDGTMNGNQSTLEFSDSDWNSTQTVSVSAGEDMDTTNDVVTLKHALSGGGFSGTGNLVVTVDDNDGATVTLATGATFIAESGANNKTDVTITLGQDLLAGERVTVPLSVTGATVATHYTLGLKTGATLNTGVTVDTTTSPYTTQNPAVIFDGAGARTATLELVAVNNSDTTARTVTIAYGTGASAPSGNTRVGTLTLSGSPKAVLIPDDDSTPTVSIATASGAVTEGTAVTFTVSLSAAQAESLNALVAVSEDGDFSTTATPFTRLMEIPAGQTSATLVVATTGDSTDEPDGSITATLGGSTEYSISSSAGSVSREVYDDDGGPTVIIKPKATAAVTEGTGAVFTVSRRPSSSSALTVDLDVDDDAHSDFVASSDEGSQTVSIPANTASVDYTVSTSTDLVDEPNGSVTVTVTADSNYQVGSPASASRQVNDDDATTVTLTGDTTAVVEGDTKEFTIEIGRGLRKGETIFTSVVPAGSAEYGATKDYTLACQNPLPAGVLFCNSTSNGVTQFNFSGPNTGTTATSITVTLTTRSDNTPDDGETVNIGFSGSPSLTGLGGGATAVDNFGQFTINDLVTVTPATLSLAEGGAAGTYTAKLNKDPGNGNTVTVTPTSSDTTAVTVAPNALRFTGGGSGNWATAQTFTATAIPDADTTGETVAVSHAVGGYTGVTSATPVAVTVTDAGHGVAVSETTLTLKENMEEGKYTVRLKSQPSAGTVTIGVASSAAARATVSPASLAFDTTNWSSPQTVTVTGIADGSATVSHTVTATGDNTNYPTTLNIASVAVTVTALPEVKITTAQSSVVEGTTLTYTVNVTPSQSSALTVNLSVTEDATDAGDMVSASNEGTDKTVEIAANATSATYTVATDGDTTDEANSSLTVALRPGSAYKRVSGSSTVTSAITDNDATTVTLTGDTGALGEGADKDFTLSIGRGLVSGEVLSIPLSFSGTAARGATADYTMACESPLPTGVTCSNLNSGTLMVVFTGPNSGATATEITLTLTARDDGASDSDETVNVGVGTPTATSLAGGVGTPTDNFGEFIINEDGVTVTPVTLALTEGGAAGSYTAKPNKDPGGGTTVVVTPTSADTTAVTVSPGSHSFTGGSSGTWKTAKTFTVTAIEDGDTTGETVNITHGVTNYGTVTSAPMVVVTVTDAGKGVLVSRSALSVKENGGEGKYTLRLKSQPASGTVTLSVTSDDTAKATVSPASLAFNTTNWSSLQTVTVTGVADGSATVSHAVASADDTTNYPTTLTIPGVAVTVADLPEVSIEPKTNTNPVTEGTAAVFTVTRAGGVGGTTNALTVTLRVADAPGSDFLTGGQSGNEGDKTVDIPAGTATVDFSVDTETDSTDEPDGPVTVTVQPDAGYTISSAMGSATRTVNDDDPTVVTLARVSSNAGALTEGNTKKAEFTVSLSRDLVAGERIDVPLVISGAGVVAADIEDVTTKIGSHLNTGVTVLDPGTLTPTVSFEGAGARTATLEIGVTDDTTIEGLETMTVALGTNTQFDADTDTNVGGGADPHGTTKEFSVPINDDDFPAVTIAPQTNTDPVTEGTAAVFTVTRTGVTTNALTVKLQVEDDPDSDFLAADDEGNDKTVDIPAGTDSVTYSVDTVDDSTDEPDGSVTVTVLQDAANYTLGSPSSATRTVQDNDTSRTGGGGGGDDATPPLPTVSIRGGNAVTEGGDALFTLSRSGAVTEALTVLLAVAENEADDRDFVTSANQGNQQVVIPAGATSTTTTVATDDDDVDEPDGAVTVVVRSSDAYTTGTAATATVVVTDNDEPSPDTPVVSISGGSAVTEGDDAVFTLTATPAPAAGTSVTVNLAVAASDNVATSSHTPSRSVTIGTEGTASFTVATEDDNAYEPAGGSITATVEGGTGYLPHADDATAVVTVADNDPAPDLMLSPSGQAGAVPVLPAAGGSFSYTVALSLPPSGSGGGSGAVVLLSDGGVVRVVISGPEGSGITVEPAELVFTSRNWNVPQMVRVTVPEGTTTVSLSHHVSGGGYDNVQADVMVRVTAAHATALRGWHSRMGRTVSQQVADALRDRFSGPPTPPGLQLTMAGEDLTGPTPLAENQQVLAKALGFEPVTVQQLVEGSSFSFSPPPLAPPQVGAEEEAAQPPPRFALWGQGALSSFSGQQHNLSFDGNVTTALLGAEWSRNRWQAGAALSRSWGSGAYEDQDQSDNAARNGDVTTSMTGVFPYGRYALTPRLGVWAVAGYGWGELSLETHAGEEHNPGAAMTMAALGLDGLLLDGGTDGFSLAATADLLTVQTSSEAVDALDASEGSLSRIRLGLEASRPLSLANDASLLPSMEIGVRQDRGDAETGFGMELGAGIAWNDPRHGVSAQLKGRTLLSHAEEDFQEQGLAVSFSWDPQPTNRGPSFSVSHSLGVATEGGMDALLNSAALEALDADRRNNGTQQFETRLAYGFPAFNDRFTITPALRLTLSSDSRNYSLLWALAPYDQQQGQGEPSEVSLEGERQESSTATPPVEHALKLRFSLLF